MLTYYSQQKSLLKLRKINRYLFLDASNFLIDAFNTFDNCLLNKIEQSQESKKYIDQVINEDLNVKQTMPKCYCDEQKNKTRTNYKTGNVPEKCTCSAANPQIRKVLASNKAYNYNKLPEEKTNNNNQVPCYCTKGNRCYCCFDSTDEEEHIKKDNIKPTKRNNELNRTNNNTSDHDCCPCNRNCFGSGKNAEADGKDRGNEKRGRRNENGDDDEFLLIVKDRESKKKAPPKSYNAKSKVPTTYASSKVKKIVSPQKRSDRSSKPTDYEGRYHRKSVIDDVGSYEEFKRYKDESSRRTGRSSNVHSERVADVEEIYNRRRAPMRSTSDESLSTPRPYSRRPKEVTPDQMKDINNFRDKYYFECHAVPKDQFYRSHGNRGESRNGNQNMNSKPFNDNEHRDKYGAKDQMNQGFCCNCNCPYKETKQYRLNDYGARRSRYPSNDTRVDLDKRIRSEERQPSNIPSSDECAPNYTINIPEICFRFPINGGKVIFHNRGEDSVKDSNEYRRRNDRLSVSLKDENGFIY